MARQHIMLALLIFHVSWQGYTGRGGVGIGSALGSDEGDNMLVFSARPHQNFPAVLGEGCPQGCNGRGRCVDGKCRCAVVWAGEACETARRLPCDQETVPFTGWVFNAATLPYDIHRYKDQLCNASQWTTKPGQSLASYSAEDCKADLKRLMHEQLMLPPVDPIMSLLGATCAVVGSSDHMLGCGAGSEIDGHDVVIRLNDAPTVGHERDVGSRTTLRFQGAARMTFREGDEWTINLSYAYLFVGGGRNLLTYPEIAGHHGYYTDHPRPNGLQLSYGWKTIHAALHICSSVTLYGFTTAADGDSNQRGDLGPTNGFGHYYQKWFDGKSYARFLWKRLGVPNMWKQWHDLRKWWRMGQGDDRQEFTRVMNSPGNIQVFEASSENPHFPCIVCRFVARPPEQMCFPPHHNDAANH
eukprot:jgi/Mesvir1/21777/Mv04175-RA.2